MDTALKSEGLPPLRWYDVLWELERSKRDGLRPFEIEKTHLFEQSNLSRLLQRLVDEGLVEALEFPDDGRGKLLRITNRGRATRKRMWQVYGPLIHQYMGRVVDVKESDRATKILKSLID